MIDKVFVDTNVLIYAYDLDNKIKNEQSKVLLKNIWENRNGVISTQVLQEFYVNVTKKIPTPIKPAQARNIIKNYITWQVEVITPEAVLLASEIEENYHLSFWDSVIITCAKNAEAKKIVTEDLNHGQLIEGILIENPFLSG